MRATGVVHLSVGGCGDEGVVLKGRLGNAAKGALKYPSACAERPQTQRYAVLPPCCTCHSQDGLVSCNAPSTFTRTPKHDLSA